MHFAWWLFTHHAKCTSEAAEKNTKLLFYNDFLPSKFLARHLLYSLHLKRIVEYMECNRP